MHPHDVEFYEFQALCQSEDCHVVAETYSRGHYYSSQITIAERSISCTVTHADSLLSLCCAE